MNEYRIAVIGGDGVGPEVVAAGMGVLGAAASGFSLAWEHLPWGSDYYQANGVMMPGRAHAGHPAEVGIQVDVELERAIRAAGPSGDG
jgi:isocitrate/isopropylmalate dehydrogenase